MTTPCILDLRNPALVEDPYPAYHRQRSAAPICYDERSGMWLVTSFEHVSAILRDRRFGRPHPDLRPPAEPAPFDLLDLHSLMEKEPPDHTRLRGLVSKAFTPGRAEALREPVRRLAHRLIDTLPAQGEFDLLDGFAAPLPVMVIGELLGIPRAEWEHLRPWSRAIVAMYELGPTEADRRRANQAVVEFSEMLRRQIAQRRSAPGADLLSALVNVELEGGRLTEDELVATSILLLNAGHEATQNVLVNGVLALLRHPDQLGRLRAQSELWRGAAEEILRYDTPLQFFRRYAYQEVEYAGHVFPRGAEVGLLFAAANRDPARFPDPDRFDVTRGDSGHLGFGAGIHYCLGAPLARIEIAEGLSALFSRLPGLRLGKQPPRYRPNIVIRGLEALWVRADGED